MLKVLVPCSIPLRPRGPAFGKLGHFSKVLVKSCVFVTDFLSDLRARLSAGYF